MKPEEGFWILRPFNALFMALFAAFLLLLAGASLALRGRSDRARRTTLAAACVVTLIGYFVYKHFLSMDEAYHVLRADMGGFNWWGELPLHLCNINMILIPIAVMKRNRPLMSFCFFVGPLGALMALMMPGSGFDRYSLLLPRILGYFGTHFMILIEGWAIVSFGLLKPRFSDLPRTILAILAVTLGVFGINVLMRWSGLYAKANYFFSMETEGNFLLEIFHRWIPYPFLYLMPCVLILAAYMALVLLGFALAERLRRRGTDK